MRKFAVMFLMALPMVSMAETMRSAVIGKVAELKDIETLTPKSKRGETYWAGNGSGCFVSKEGWVITNCHVIEGATEIVIVYEGTAYLMRIVKKNKDKDLALLEFDGFPYEVGGAVEFEKFKRPVFSHVSVRKDELAVGDQVTVVGYPQIGFQGLEAKVTRGIVSSATGFKGDKDNFQMDAAISGGNSGGPVFDANGALSGITVASYRAGENANYAIKIGVLRGFVGDTVKLESKCTEHTSRGAVARMIQCSVLVLNYKVGARPHDIETQAVREGNEIRARVVHDILTAQLMKVRKEWKELKELTDGLIESRMADDAVVAMNQQASEELGLQLVVYAEVEGADVKARIKPISGIRDAFVQCEEAFALDGGSLKRGFTVKAELSYYTPQGALWKGMLDEIYDWRGTKEIRIKLNKVVIK